MRRRSVIKRSAALGTGVAIAGCLGSGDGSTSFPDPFIMNDVTESLSLKNIPAYVEFPEILSREEDVSFDSTVYSNYTKATVGVINDEGHMLPETLSSISKARNQGFPTKGIVGLQSFYNYPFVVRPEIESWEDLRGGTVALHSPSASTALCSRVMIREELGSVDAVNYQMISGSGNRLAAIESGEVDGANVTLSLGTDFAQRGLVDVLGGPWNYEPLQNNVISLYATTESNIENKRDAWRRVRENLLNSYEWAANASEEELKNRAIGHPKFPDINEDVFLSTYKTVQENNLWPVDGDLLTVENIEKTYSILAEFDMISDDERVDPAEIIADL